MSVNGKSAIKGYIEECDMVRDGTMASATKPKMIASDLSGLSARPL